MKILVTGGTGFIGAEVAKRLDARGDRVTAFDLYPNEARFDGAKVEVAQGDLGDAETVDDVVAKTKPEVIFHLGGMLSLPSEADHHASFRANAQGTLNVLEAATAHGVKQVIFSSTIGTYGRNIEGETLDDDTLQRPNLFYGATKVFCEHLGIWFKKKHGLDFRGVRYPGVVGPGVKTPGIGQYNPWMIEAAIQGEPFTVWARADTRHGILYYKDAAAGALMLADAPAGALSRAVYTITGPRPSPSAGELADEVKRQIPGAEITFDSDPERQKVLDDLERPINDDRSRVEWGWAPKFGLEEMVRDFRETLAIE